MKAPIRAAAILVMLLAAAACGRAAPTDPGVLTAAHQIVTQLQTGDDAAVESQLAAAVQQQLSTAQLASAWQQATASLGAYESQAKTVSGQAAGGTEVVVTCAFAHGTLDVRLHFDAQHTVDGLYLQPHPASS